MANTSRHQTILDTIQTAIRAAGLVDIRDEQVVIRTNAEHYNKWIDSKQPGIILSPIGTEKINVKSPGTNASDDIGYPVLISIVDDVLPSHSNVHQDKRLFWREKIIDTFIHFRLAGAINYDIDVVPGPIVEPGAWTQQRKFLSIIELTVTQRVQRRA